MKSIKWLPSWDRGCIALFVMLFVTIQVVAAQSKLPVIKATSKKVDVKDGVIFQKQVWNLSPEVKPDVYNALTPEVDKRITFFTDIDSVSFDVKPGNTYDFIIVLNNKDSCYTQISSLVSAPENRVSLNTIEVNKLKQDFTIFRENLQKEHAGLYRYKSKKEVDRLLDSCYAALKHPMTQLQFGKMIMFLVSSIEDGHTGTNVPRLLINQYRENEKLFPFYLYFVDYKAYTLCGSTAAIPRGTEILSIDNKPIASILKELYRYLPSDGKIETKKRQTINDGAFPFLYSFVFGSKNSFSVQFKTKQGTVKTTAVQADYFKEFECTVGNQSGNNQEVQLQFLPSNSVLLTVKTFDGNRFNGKQSFNDFLEESLKAIAAHKVKNLIIDLRGNGGGNDEYGALLYSYLTNKPFRYFASKSSITHRVELEENPLLGPQKPQKTNYQGKVFFLINGLCFSTTADFCAVARSNERGKFIGEETGGGYFGNTSGGNKNVKLPNSAIEVRIPLFKYVNEVKKANYKDRGIIPDFVVIPTVSEVIENKDVQLNYALRLAKSTK